MPRAVEQQEAEPAPVLKHADGTPCHVVSLVQQRRITAGFLINHCDWTALSAARAVGFKRAADAAKWAERLAKYSSVDDDGAAWEHLIEGALK